MSKNSIPSPFTEVRPVVRKDRWCNFTKPREDETATFGYVMVMPFPKSDVKLNDLKGYIIRARKKQGQLLLQVCLTQRQFRKYGIDHKEVELEQRKKKRKVKKIKRHVVNIRNFNKGQPYVRKRRHKG